MNKPIPTPGLTVDQNDVPCLTRGIGYDDSAARRNVVVFLSIAFAFIMVMSIALWVNFPPAASTYTVHVKNVDGTVGTYYHVPGYTLNNNRATTIIITTADGKDHVYAIQNVEWVRE